VSAERTGGLAVWGTDIAAPTNAAPADRRTECRRGGGRRLHVGSAALALLLAGCGATPGGSGRPSSNIESEPNDEFGQALKAGFDGTGRAVLEGTIEHFEDLDVYAIGALSVGDRLTIDVDSLTAGFDASIAVFDPDFSLFFDNDDRNLGSARLDPHLSAVVRHAGDPYYLVVGPSAFASAGDDVGSYRASVSIQSNQEVPPPRRQVFLLDFSGGQIEADNLLVNEVNPFDAAAIDSTYAGLDEQIIDAIIETLGENYEALDVLLVTDPAELPPGEDHATIMFGSHSRLAFGIAEAVDHYNTNHADTAIIFTESFEPARFTAAPTARQLGLAIGNIAAHEAGHLLGLNHVDDPTALMDGASPADTFLGDQDFKKAVLSQDILPIGFQDAPLLLSESIGSLDGAPLRQRTARPAYSGPRLRRADAAIMAGGQQAVGEYGDASVAPVFNRCKHRLQTCAMFP